MFGCSARILGVTPRRPRRLRRRLENSPAIGGCRARTDRRRGNCSSLALRASGQSTPRRVIRGTFGWRLDLDAGAMPTAERHFRNGCHAGCHAENDGSRRGERRGDSEGIREFSNNVARPAGLEPAAPGLEGRNSLTEPFFVQQVTLLSPRNIPAFPRKNSLTSFSRQGGADRVGRIQRPTRQRSLSPIGGRSFDLLSDHTHRDSARVAPMTALRPPAPRHLIIVVVNRNAAGNGRDRPPGRQPAPKKEKIVISDGDEVAHSSDVGLGEASGDERLSCRSIGRYFTLSNTAVPVGMVCVILIPSCDTSTVAGPTTTTPAFLSVISSVFGLSSLNATVSKLGAPLAG
jgi:hypothetical protein